MQKLYTHFRKAPATHKLGVLYVVDSVTRKWIEQAKAAGQPLGTSAPDGSYGAGVHRVKELLPVLMNDIIANAPQDQKVRFTTLMPVTLYGCARMTRSCSIIRTMCGFFVLLLLFCVLFRISLSSITHGDSKLTH